MALRLRPGCVVRSTLALLSILFFPLAVWFAWTSVQRYWSQSLGLLIVAALCARLAIGRSELLDALEDPGGPANPDHRD